jgi:hypothetical protein
MVNKRLIAMVMPVAIVFAWSTCSLKAATAYQGYVFCAVGQTAYLLNPSGTTVHTWKATSSARSYAHLLPDGSALFPIQTTCTVQGDGAYPHGRVQKISWDGQVVWDAVVCDVTFTPGYTIEPMPNGNFLVAGASSTGGLKIVEIQPSGTSGKTVVWEYTLPDSLGKTGYINSVSYNPELKYVGIDINQAKKVVVIDYAKKSIVYTYAITSGTATHAAMWVTKYFLGTDIVQPDADITAMRTNNLLVINNSAQAIEVNPVAKAFVKNIPFAFSAHEGSVQRLPNGNTLVNAANNRAVELSENGAAVSTVRTINLPGNVARAYMYGPSYPGLKTYTRVKATASSPAITGKFVYNSTTNTGRISLEDKRNTAFDVRIFAFSGKLVHSSRFLGTNAVFSTDDFSSGVYYIDIRDVAGSFKSYFVKM